MQDHTHHQEHSRADEHDEGGAEARVVEYHVVGRDDDVVFVVDGARRLPLCWI